MHDAPSAGGRDVKRVVTAPTLLQSVRMLPAAAWTLFAGTLINKLGNYLQLFLVLYLTSRGHSVPLAGLALGAAGVGNLVGSGIGGTIADRLGRKRTITISMLGSGALTALVPFVQHIVAVILLVMTIGILAQLYRPAAAAILIDVVDESEHVTAFAAYRLAINVGMAAGPLIAGFMSSRSYTLVFVGDAMSSVLYGLLAAALLPETAPPATPTLSKEQGYAAALRDRSYVMFLLAMAAAGFLYTQSVSTLPLHMARAGLSNSDYGLLLCFNAAIVVLLELPISTRTKRMPAHAVVAIGLLMLGVGFGATGLATSLGAAAAAVVLWSFGEMVYAPIAYALPGRYSPPHLRGRYQGMYGVAHTAGMALGPTVGGLLFSVGQPLLWASCLGIGVLGCLLTVASRSTLASA